MDQISKTLKSICLWCGQPNHIIWVHGHGQCSVCGYNIDECCKGEICEQLTVQNQIKKETEYLETKTTH